MEIADPLRLEEADSLDAPRNDVPLTSANSPRSVRQPAAAAAQAAMDGVDPLSVLAKEPAGSGSQDVLAYREQDARDQQQQQTGYHAAQHNHMPRAASSPLEHRQASTSGAQPSGARAGRNKPVQSRSLNGAQSGRAAGGLLEISVTDPVQRVSDSVIPGFTSTHTEYLVVAASSDGSSHRTEVRRRFRDFVALADLLAISHRGYFLFPRPDKNTLDQQLGKSDFVELRRQELERYLRQLAAHPVVAHSEELHVFLEGQGSLANNPQWQQLQPSRGSWVEGITRLPRQLIGSDSSVPSTSEVQQNARNTSDLLRRFRELGERMRQEYNAPPALQEEEVKLRVQERRAGLEDYADKLALASRRAEQLVKEFEEMGAVVGDFGLSLVKLAKYEDEEGSKCGQYSELGVGARTVAAHARRVGLAAVRQSRLARVSNSRAMEALEPLHDELAMSPAVVSALREREAALLTAQSITDDLERRRQALAALEESGSRRLGGDAAKARKVATMQADMQALQAAQAAAQHEYDRVKARNLQELERTQQGRTEAFSRLAAVLAEVEAEYAQSCLAIWRGVAQDFGAGGQLKSRLDRGH